MIARSFAPTFPAAGTPGVLNHIGSVANSASSMPFTSLPERALRAVIIDGDATAGGELGEELRSVAPGLEVVALPRGIEAARAALSRGDYDVVFLETCVGEHCGFELAGHAVAQAAIVFVTRRADAAVRAFEVDALDFLVKPVSAVRLARTLRQVVAFRAQRGGGETGSLIEGLFLRSARSGGRVVPAHDIVAVTSAENYSEVYLADGEQWLVRRTMEEWKRRLPEAHFARVHRCAFVNLDFVERIVRGADESTVLELRGLSRSVPVSRRAWSRVRERLRGTP